LELAGKTWQSFLARLHIHRNAQSNKTSESTGSGAVQTIIGDGQRGGVAGLESTFISNKNFTFADDADIVMSQIGRQVASISEGMNVARIGIHLHRKDAAAIGTGYI
jgi:hypothetical protein